MPMAVLKPSSLARPPSPYATPVCPPDFESFLKLENDFLMVV